MLFRACFICLVIMASNAVAQLLACSRSYVVQEGDTCNAICDSQGVSTYQLESVNSDHIDPLCDNLKAGETLCLGIKTQDCLHTHVVGTGDTCDSITESAGISISTLLANNPNILDCSTIYTLEVLCVDKVLINYTKRNTFA